MSPTDQLLEGDLVPLNNVVDLVYGGMDYARSVFGPEKITRSRITDYFDTARTTWPCTRTPKVSRHIIIAWCKQQGIKPLHYYAPTGQCTIWFKDQQDLFAFTLRFGIN